MMSRSMKELTPAPIGYWRFRSEAPLADSTPHDDPDDALDLDSNDAVIARDGQRQHAADFNTVTTGTVLDSHVPTLAALSAWSICVWFKIDSGDTTNSCVFSITDESTDLIVDDNSMYFHWFNTTGFMRMILRNGAAWDVQASFGAGLNDGQWHHFALTSDATGHSIYLDGAKVTPTYGNGAATDPIRPQDVTTADSFRFGVLNLIDTISNSSWRLDGKVDRPCVFDRVLEPGEVWSVMHQTAPRYAVVLSIGQSNGAGYNTGAILSGAGQPDEPNDRIWQWGRNAFDVAVADGEIIQASQPLHHHPAGEENVAAALPFSNAILDTLLADDDDIQILIVPAAKGSSGFSDAAWNRGDTYYEDAKDRFRAAMATNPYNVGRAVLWNQREKDATSDTDADAYEQALTTFFRDFMEDTGTSGVRWLVSGPTDAYRATNDRTERVSAATERACGLFPNISYISTVGLENDTEDGGTGGTTHFSADGQRDIGQLAADTWLEPRRRIARALSGHPQTLIKEIAPNG